MIKELPSDLADRGCGAALLLELGNDVLHYQGGDAWVRRSGEVFRGDFSEKG